MATTTDTLLFELKVKDDASRAFDAWDKRLEELEKTFKRVSANAGKLDLSGSLSKGLTGFPGVLKKFFESPFVGSFKKILTAANAAFQKIAGLTKKFVIDSIQAFGDFQQGMQEIAKTSGATEDVLESLGKKLREAVITDLKGTTTLSQLQEIAAMSAKFGIATQDIDTFSTSVAKMSKLWDLSVGKTGESAAKLISQYKLSAEQIENVGSAIDKIADSFATSENYILNFTQRVSGAAKMTNQSLAEVAGIAARIATETGMGAEAASSSYAKVLTKMQLNTAKFAAVLGGTTKQWTDLVNTNGAEAFNLLLTQLEKIKNTKGPTAYVEAVNDLFGANTRVNQLLSGMIGTVDGNRAAMEAASKAFEEGTRINTNYAASIDTQNASIAQVKAQWLDFSISMGEALAPIMAGLLEVVQTDLMPLVDQFAAWVQTSEDAQHLLGETIPDAIRFLGEAAKVTGEVFVKIVGWIEGAATKLGEFIEKVLHGIQRIRDMMSTINDATKLQEEMEKRDVPQGAITQGAQRAGITQTGLTQGARAKAYALLGKEAETSAEQIEAVKTATEAATEATQTLADVAFVHSTYPGIQDEAILTSQRILELTREIELSTQTVTTLGRQSVRQFMTMQQQITKTTVAMTELNSVMEQSVGESAVDQFRLRKEFEDLRASRFRKSLGQGPGTGIMGMEELLINRGRTDLLQFLHTGGIVKAHNGLRPDEMPIIAQSGEGVVSRKGMKAFDDMNQGKTSGASIVNNITINGKVIEQSFIRELKQELNKLERRQTGGS